MGKEEGLQRIPIGRILLGIIAVAGIVPLLVIAPGLGAVLKQIEGERRRSFKKRYLESALGHLQQKGYIRLEGERGSRKVRITDSGRRYLASKRTTLLYRPKKRSWDGYWRVVMFDIPEKSRKLRHVLRRELSEVGFKKLQGSVWVSPDECEEYIKLLKADKHIGKRLIYLKTKDLEYGSAIAQMFRIEKS